VPVEYSLQGCTTSQTCSINNTQHTDRVFNTSFTSQQIKTFMNSRFKGKKVTVKHNNSLWYKHRTTTGASMPHGITPSCLPPGTGSVWCPYPGQYSIYPPIKDERLSRPKPMQVNDLLWVASEVLAVPRVSWLSPPSAPVGTIAVNNLPTVVI